MANKRKTTRKQPGAIRDRIKEFIRVPASELVPNERNWREHPKSQHKAMKAVLAEVGFADALLAYRHKGKLKLIDGHLRADLASATEVPVLVLDVTEEEANKILFSLDPIGAMAEANLDQLQTLADGMTFDTPEFSDLIDLLQPSPLLEPGEAPESVRRNSAELTQIKSAQNENFDDKQDTEHDQNDTAHMKPSLVD